MFNVKCLRFEICLHINPNYILSITLNMVLDWWVYILVYILVLNIPSFIYILYIPSSPVFLIYLRCLMFNEICSMFNIVYLANPKSGTGLNFTGLHFSSQYFCILWKYLKLDNRMWFVGGVNRIISMHHVKHMNHVGGWYERSMFLSIMW